MATALPAFPEFDVSETSTQATWWKEWLSRLQKLIVALKVTDKTRQWALLLHYAGEGMNKQGVKLTFFSGSHLAPKYVKVVANSKTLVAIMTHTQKSTKIRMSYKEDARMGQIQP